MALNAPNVGRQETAQSAVVLGKLSDLDIAISMLVKIAISIIFDECKH
jgi:hypothetical protein